MHKKFKKNRKMDKNDHGLQEIDGYIENMAKLIHKDHRDNKYSKSFNTWAYDFKKCIQMMTYGVSVRKLSKNLKSSRLTSIFLDLNQPENICWATKRKKLIKATINLQKSEILIPTQIDDKGKLLHFPDELYKL